MTNFSPRLWAKYLNELAKLRLNICPMCLQASVLIIHWHCFQVSYARAHLTKSGKFASKRTLDYFRRKYPEYANNWLVSQIAVRAETVKVTAHLVGCNT